MVYYNFCSVCILLVVFCFKESSGNANNEGVEGYYWRDYAGFIPHDAFPGGTEKGVSTYVAQILFKDLLVPGKIIKGDEKAYFEWGFQEHVARENIKILCADDPKLLQWLSTKGAEFKNIKHKLFISGGHEPNADIYVGRTNNEGEKLIGKLVVNDAVVLHASINGKSVESTEFEVLYYKDPKGDIFSNSSQDYYWRDYTGIIPPDALPGGVQSGTTTYIAQIVYNNLLVPGTIVRNVRKATFEWGLRAHTATENIKIFCTDRPDSFHWLATTSNEFKKITDKLFLIGGNEEDGTIYIGRTNNEGDIFVGKLLVNAEVYLHTAQNGKSVQSRVFEVLYYQPPTSKKQ